MKYGLIVLAGIIIISAYFLIFNNSKPVTNFPSNGENIIAFGDSLIEGVGSTDGNDLISILSDRIGEQIINLGKSGDTTRDALERIDDVIDQDPKIVLVLLGGNDYLKKIPPTETFENLEIIIEKIHESGSVVLLLGVRGGVLRDNFKDDFEKISEKHNTGFVSNVLEGLITNPELMSDLIHPNNMGYLFIADRVQPKLEKLIK